MHVVHRADELKPSYREGCKPSAPVSLLLASWRKEFLIAGFTCSDSGFLSEQAGGSITSD